MSAGRFVPTDVLSDGRFVSTDVFSPRTFCPYRRFVHGRFVSGRFVSGRFVCAPKFFSSQCQTFLPHTLFQNFPFYVPLLREWCLEKEKRKKEDRGKRRHLVEKQVSDMMSV
jgi:hypothetical protein